MSNKTFFLQEIVKLFFSIVLRNCTSSTAANRMHNNLRGPFIVCNSWKCVRFECRFIRLYNVHIWDGISILLKFHVEQWNRDNNLFACDCTFGEKNWWICTVSVVYLNRWFFVWKLRVVFDNVFFFTEFYINILSCSFGILYIFRVDVFWDLRKKWFKQINNMIFKSYYRKRSERILVSENYERIESFFKKYYSSINLNYSVGFQ